MKKIIAFVLCVMMLLSAFPTALLAKAASNTTYDSLEPGDSVKILYTNTAQSATIGTTSKKYTLYSHKYDAGTSHEIKFRKFASGNTKNYDPNIIFYCIELGKDDSGKAYTAYSPDEHSYWKGLSAIAREGILLTMGLGYHRKA